MNELTIEQLNEKEKNLLSSAKEAGEYYLNKKDTRHAGAALLGANDKIYLGTSIRRTNVSNSTCAERMALDKAIFNQCYEYELLAIVGFYDDEKIKEILAPCGTCRQILSEAETYGDKIKPINILLANENFSKIIKTTSSELFPVAYEAKKYK